MSHTKTTWHHLRRSPFQSMAALTITSVSFFVIVSYFIFAIGLATVVQYFTTKPEITIFLQDGLDRAQVESLQKELSSYPDVKEIKFISKEKALEIYRQQNQNNPLLTEMVTASILPASFEVSVTNPATLKTIYSNFSAKDKLVEEIIFEQEIVDSLIAWSAVLQRVGLATSVTLLIVTFFIILTIIGMKITNHKDEIRISRLLGASRLYVESPFIQEGIFYGFVGSLNGAGLSLLLALSFRDQINHFFNPIKFIGQDPIIFGLIILIATLLGILIGYLSSWSSARRFIKF